MNFYLTHGGDSHGHQRAVKAKGSICREPWAAALHPENFWQVPQPQPPSGHVTLRALSSPLEVAVSPSIQLPPAAIRHPTWPWCVGQVQAQISSQGKVLENLFTWDKKQGVLFSNPSKNGKLCCFVENICTSYISVFYEHCKAVE